MREPWLVHGANTVSTCLGEIYGVWSHKKPWNHRMNNVKHLRWEWRGYQLPCLGEIYGVRSHPNTRDHHMDNVKQPRWAWWVHGANKVTTSLSRSNVGYEVKSQWVHYKYSITNHDDYDDLLNGSSSCKQSRRRSQLNVYANRFDSCTSVMV